MSLYTKVGRLADMFRMSRSCGLGTAFKVALNRYRFDRFTSQRLPEQCKSGPYAAQIETSRVCNLRCRMCEYSYRQDNGAIMPLATFQKILDQLPTISSLDMTGIGEPFCNRYFLDCLRYAKSKGLRLKFSTNGNLLTNDRIAAVVDIGVDEIWFSLDAATKPIHERIRKGSDFDRVTKAILTLSERAEKTGMGIPRRCISYTLSRENIEEAPQVIGLAKRLGVAWVEFRDLIVFDEGAYSEDTRIDSMSDRRLAAIRNQILAEQKRTGIDVTMPRGLGAEVVQCVLCMDPWASVFIDIDANLYPCCRVTQRNEDITKNRMGNLLSEQFKDIWNSQKYRQLRRIMAHPVSIPPMCVRCDMVVKRGDSRQSTDGTMD